MKKLNHLPFGKEDLMLRKIHTSFVENIIRLNCLSDLKSDKQLEFLIGSVVTPYVSIFKNKYYINPLVYEKLSDDVKAFVKGEYRHTTCVFKKGYRPNLK